MIFLYIIGGLGITIMLYFYIIPYLRRLKTFIELHFLMNKLEK